MAKMSMEYADLGEELEARGAALSRHFTASIICLQAARLERAQMQILCGDVMQEFDAATRQVGVLLSARARVLLCNHTPWSPPITPQFSSLILLFNSPL